ncbi:MAG: UbiD family decarboxylase [Chloroflexi bacterium]|nr:UbiD family decarboxylase [Chloroflexota bacterium]
MPYSDLRQFLNACRDIGELRTIDGADWDLEIGTIAELNYEHLGPALLFDNIKGYPPGYRVATNIQDARSRALLSIDLPIDLDIDASMAGLVAKTNSYQPVPPTEVTEGPILENVFFGDEIDLLKFPTPRWHENDGDARYLGTGCAVILRDPDTGNINMGTYRVQVHDRKTVGLYITPNKKGATIRQKYWERGLSCPVAVSIGHDPLLFLAASNALGRVNRYKDYSLLGHFSGAPYPVIMEEITGLPIPANAEIVIAGECPPPDVESRPEGPFGEWTGYYASGTRPEPIIRVKALYHRNDPIIFGCPPERHRHGTGHFGIPQGRGGAFARLKAMTPGFTVVQIQQRYPGHALKAGLALVGQYMGRFIVVVDEDINVRDPEDVLWAIGTRCDPATTITVVPGTEASALDPRIHPDKKAKGDYTASQVIINACKPYEWIKDFPRTNIASPELRAQVRAKWGDLLSS